MSDVLDDLGNVAGDLKDVVVDAVEGDYHAAAGAFDYVTGDQAGADDQFTQMHASADAAWGAVDQGGKDLEQGFKDAGIDPMSLATGPTIELD
jgi:hypothetical protein